MTPSTSHASYGVYWSTWALLLCLTLAMLATGYLSLSRVFIVSLLVLAMLLKASLIGANFMHLRFERAGLVVMVVVAILGTAAVLFALIAIDGIRILKLTTR